MEVRTNENGKVVINANADVFIIPNHGGKVESFFTYAQPHMIKVGMENLGDDFDVDKEMFAECWLTSDFDMGSDNINDHGFCFTTEDGEQHYCAAGQISRFIPSSCFKGLKEGDSTNLVFNVKATNKKYGLGEDEDKDIKVELHLNTTLAQKKYRYRNFGNFEDVLRKVC